jgi:acyl-coenzyme A synthetase/AMP-(fatty) acid ligase
MRPPPSTAEYVETFAAREPQRLALREDRHALSYGALHLLLQQCALQLRGMGLRRGQRIAVAGPGFGIQLVLLLAAEAMGLVTASFDTAEDGDAPWLLARVDAVFAAVPQQVPAGVRFTLLDAEFAASLSRPLAEPAPAWTPLSSQEPQRFTRTSGSSGQAKFMLLNRAAQEWWIQGAAEAWQWELDSDTRLLLLAPLTVNAAFARAAVCLRRGGALLVGEGGDIAAMDPTHVIGLPLQLRRLLDALPAGYVAPRAVSVATFGGVAGPALRERAEAIFRGRIFNRYGSNEAGVICDAMDDEGQGVLRPGVEVRILDEGGGELPSGHEGRIAIRTPCLVDGYIERPEETAAAFRDGWFVSGDVGTLVAPRVLRLAGRHDELVTIAGVKVPASKVEAELMRRGGLVECAVVTVNLEGGSVSLAVAAVLAAGVTEAQGQEQVRAGLQLPPGIAVRLVFLPALPRLAGGKVDRMALLRMLR